MDSPRSIAAFLSSAGIAAGLAIVVAAGACSSFGTDDSGSGSGSDGADATLATDAPGTADAPGTRDGSEAAAVMDAGGLTNAFCAAHAGDPGLFYCNDFEMPAQAMEPFGFAAAMITPSTTALMVTPDGQRTAVLKATVNAPNPASHEVSVRQSLGLSTGGPLPVQIDLDIKILTNNTASVTLAASHVDGTGCEGEYGLGAFDGQTVGGTRTRDVTLLPYADGTWTHLTISVKKDASSSTGYREVTTYGGSPLVDREAHASSGIAPTQCIHNNLLLGITESGADAANVIVLFDNVLVRKL